MQMKRISGLAVLMLFAPFLLAQEDSHSSESDRHPQLMTTAALERPVLQPGSIRLSGGEIDSLIYPVPDSDIVLPSLDAFLDHRGPRLEFRKLSLFSRDSRVRVFGPRGETLLPRAARDFYLATNSDAGVGLAVDAADGTVTGFLTRGGQRMKISGNFMGHSNGNDCVIVFSLSFGKGLDNGRKIGAAVSEKRFHAAGGQQFKVCFGNCCS